MDWFLYDINLRREKVKAFETQIELHHSFTTLKVFNAEKRTPLLSYDF